MKKLFILLALASGLTISVCAQTGGIAGKLTYPGEEIPPDLILCVKQAEGKQTFCSNEHPARLREANVAFKLNFRPAVYRISLPAGSYFLYAAFPKGKAPAGEMEGMKAFYNDFVKCGMSVDCPSKKAIIVKVKAGRIVKGITVGDWYQ